MVTSGLRKLTRLTRPEKNWIGIIISSKLSQGQFSANEARMLIKETPLREGSVRKHVPDVRYLDKILKKSPQFSFIKKQKKNIWFYDGDAQ